VNNLTICYSLLWKYSFPIVLFLGFVLKTVLQQGHRVSLTEIKIPQKVHLFCPNWYLILLCIGSALCIWQIPLHVLPIIVSYKKFKILKKVFHLCQVLFLFLAFVLKTDLQQGHRASLTEMKIAQLVHLFCPILYLILFRTVSALCISQIPLHSPPNSCHLVKI